MGEESRVEEEEGKFAIAAPTRAPVAESSVTVGPTGLVSFGWWWLRLFGFFAGCTFLQGAGFRFLPLIFFSTVLHTSPAFS